MILHMTLVVALGIGDCDIVTVYHAKILLHLVPYPNDSITNGNQPQYIVSHLVLDQVIVL